MKKKPAAFRDKTTFNLYEAKTNLSKLVERAAKGEEIVIAKRGEPVARLTRAEPKKKPIYGLWKGKVWIADDFDAPLPPDIQRYFDGDFNDFEEE